MSDFDENLFERADPDGLLWRCKGCRDLVKRSERERHYKAHRTIQERSERERHYKAHRTIQERAERKAAQYLQQQRLRNLERARAAKGAA